jgi:hypothetical protein
MGGQPQEVDTALFVFTHASSLAFFASFAAATVLAFTRADASSIAQHLVTGLANRHPARNFGIALGLAALAFVAILHLQNPTEFIYFIF